MAAKGVKPTGKRFLFVRCGIIGALVLFILCVIGIGVGWIISSEVGPLGEVTTLIITPQNGETVVVNDSVELQAGASDPKGVSRLELYADGALVAAQDTSLDGGSNPLILTSAWAPATVGRHVLVARGYATDERFADSSAIFLDVTEPPAPGPTELDVDAVPREPGSSLPSLSGLASATGTTVEDILSHSPGLSGVDPDAPLPPGTHVTIPPPPSPPSGRSASPPSPPSPPPPPRSGGPTAPTNLVVTPECTSVTLTWSDSPDEGSYVIYRLAAGEPRPHVVATLPANTTRYVDALPAYMDYYYQVAARRAGRESLGPMVLAALPGGCLPPPPLPGIPDLVLTLVDIETDSTYDGVYCYARIDSLPPDHFPAGSFSGIPPTAPRYYSLAGLPNRGRYLLSGHPAGTPVTLSVNCMGRNVPLADDLGTFNVSHPPEEWDGSLRVAASRAPGVGTGFRMHYCLGSASIPCTAPGATPPPDPIALVDPYLPPPTSLRLGRSFEPCMDLPTERDRGLCILVGAFTGGISTVFWDWDGGAYVNESDLTAYHVILAKTNLRSGRVVTEGEWDVLRRADGTLPKLMMDRVPNPPACGTRYLYYAFAVARDRRSVESDPVWFDTPPCFEPVDVTVRFDSLTMASSLDDLDECCGFWCSSHSDELELSASLQVISGSDSWSEDLTRPASVTPGGTYTFSSLWGGSYQHGVHFVDPRQTLTIIATVYENDMLFPCSTGLFGSTPLCTARFEVPVHTSAEWNSYYQEFAGGSSTSEGGCTFSIRASGPAGRP